MNYNPFSLKNKTILITGASSGIGKTTALECSKMGAKLILIGRNSDRLIETYEMLDGDNHAYICADLTNYTELEEIASSVDYIDGLVLSAGKSNILPFSFSTKEKFSEVFDINFFSTIELTRQLVNKKKIKNNSSIVFITSIAGTYNFSVGHSIYGTSKAALQSIVGFCAIELSHKKIRVNSVCPGMVETKMINSGILTDEQLINDKNEYPLKRYGTTQDIAYGIIYLLSDASSWITGHSLIIDGGRTII